MKIKSQKVKWAPTVLISCVIALGACMKLAAIPQVLEVYSKIGLLPFVKLLALTELFFVIIFVYPRTLKLGLLLLTGYFGGAMGVELSHGTIFVAPAVILLIVWIGAYLRDPSLFGLTEKISDAANKPSIRELTKTSQEI